MREDLSIYMTPEPAGPLLQQFLDGVDRTPMNTVNFVTALNARVQQEVGYIVRLEAGVYGPEETLARRQGSCRDSGWLLVQALRHLGLAARFVSGYLIQLKPDLVSSMGHRAPTTTSPTSTPGARSICRAPDRPRPDVGPPDRRATSRSRPRRITATLPRSPAAIPAPPTSISLST